MSAIGRAREAMPLVGSRWASVPALALADAVAFALFLVGPIALRRYPFGPPGVTWQEAVDVITPFVLIPLAWLVCGFDGPARFSSRLAERLLFLVFTAAWVLGQGMHLSANSIGRLTESMGGTIEPITHFYDEVLSHYLWHIGILGFAALAIMRSLGASDPREIGPARRRLSPVLVVAALVYGATWFMVVVESGTWRLTLPVTVALGAGWWLLVRRARHQPTSAPIGAFLGYAHLVASVLLLAWAVFWPLATARGFMPQFTDLGWI